VRLPHLNFNAYYTNPCNQIRWLLFRSIKRMARDPYFIGIKLAEALALGLFIGLIYFDVEFDGNVARNYVGVLFFLMTDISFDMVYGVVQQFPLDIPMMNRDRTSGLYSPSIFYFSQVIVSVINGFMLTIIRTIVTYWMVGFKLKNGNRGAVFVLITLIYELVMQLLGW